MKPGDGIIVTTDGIVVDAQHIVAWLDLEAQPGLGTPKQSLIGKLGL